MACSSNRMDLSCESSTVRVLQQRPLQVIRLICGMYGMYQWAFQFKNEALISF